MNLKKAGEFVENFEFGKTTAYFSNNCLKIVQWMKIKYLHRLFNLK